MHNNKKNEELQSRREFFKKAAKGALPILGALVLSGTPAILNAAEKTMGCNYGCNGSCMGCRGTCQGCSGCGGTCRSQCSSGCAHTHY